MFSGGVDGRQWQEMGQTAFHKRDTLINFPNFNK